MKSSYLSFEEQIRALVQHPELIRVTTLSEDPFQRVSVEFMKERVRHGYDPFVQRMLEDQNILGSEVA